MPKIFQERPLLTLDYVPGYKSEHQDYGPLSCVPVASQESSIVTDLLYCFIGINGVHVKPVKKGWILNHALHFALQFSSKPIDRFAILKEKGKASKFSKKNERKLVK